METRTFVKGTETPTTPGALPSGTHGVHPSRLPFFALNEESRESGMAAGDVMAPPPTRQDEPGFYPQGSHQPQHRTRPNGMNINGSQQQLQSQQRPQSHDRDQRQRQGNVPPLTPTGIGPMPSHIQVAKPYVFQQSIEGCLKDVSVAQAREDNLRLAGVQWIDNVRRALKLPVRTFDTAVIYYHKFRLVHSDGEYSFVDAAAAALFAACKIEDTLKKSRDILCAAHNLKIPNRAEHLSPDDSIFEHHSRAIIGLERLMLESSSFDFRNRHPQHFLVKIAKYYQVPRSSSVVKTAYAISLDLYRTFAPLKQCTATLAFACLELSVSLHDEVKTYPGIREIVEGREHYHRWHITRAEVMETMLDLLELYTHYRSSTIVGPEFALDTFLEVRIPLNQELSDRRLPRFTEYIDTGHMSGRPDVGTYAATVNGLPAAITAAVASNGTNKVVRNSPTSPVNRTATQNGMRQKAGERGKEGTVRFILNPDRERQEHAVIAEYGPLPHSLVGGKSTTPLDSGGGAGSGGGISNPSRSTDNSRVTAGPASASAARHVSGRRGGHSSGSGPGPTSAPGHAGGSGYHQRR